MSNKRYAKSGYYKGHFCRSLGEFHLAWWFDMMGYDFEMEGTVLYTVDGKKKIPDAVVKFKKQGVTYIYEVKPNQKELDDLIEEYQTFVEVPEDTKIIFVNSKRFVPLFKKIVISIHGNDYYDDVVNEYKSQEKTYTGFPGELNPMYGRKHDLETRKKIKDGHRKYGGFSGIRNPMYGKTHTEEAKSKIAKKWSCPKKKNEMKKKGMITHISNFSSENYSIFMEYAKKSINKTKSEKLKTPNFVNPAYCIYEEKIIELFGSKDNFFKEIAR